MESQRDTAQKCLLNFQSNWQRRDDQIQEQNSLVRTNEGKLGRVTALKVRTSAFSLMQRKISGEMQKLNDELEKFFSLLYRYVGSEIAFLQAREKEYAVTKMWPDESRQQF